MESRNFSKKSNKRYFIYIGIGIYLLGALFSIPFSGVVSAVLMNYEFDTLNCLKPSIIKLNDNVAVVSYTGDGNDGYIKTLSVGSNGSIRSTIDTWEFDPTEALKTEIAVVGSYIVLSYIVGNVIVLENFRIGATGIIQKTQVDTLTVTTSSEYKKIDDIVSIGTNLFAMSYSINTARYVKIYQIELNGNILLTYTYLKGSEYTQTTNTTNLLYLPGSDNNKLLVMLFATQKFSTSLGFKNISCAKVSDDGVITSKSWLNISTGLSQNPVKYVLSVAREETDYFVVGFMDSTGSSNRLMTFSVFKTGLIDDDYVVGAEVCIYTPSGGSYFRPSDLKRYNDTTLMYLSYFYSAGWSNIYSLHYKLIDIGVNGAQTIKTTVDVATSVGASPDLDGQDTTDVLLIKGCVNFIVTGADNDGWNYMYTGLPSYTESFEEEPGEGETNPVYCGYNMSSYFSIQQDGLSDNVGYNVIANGGPTAGSDIEVEYSVPIKAKIQGVGLLVSSAQVGYDSNVGHYALNINGGTALNPDCVFQYSQDSYMMFWKTSVYINNQKPLFAFLHTQALYSDVYWEVFGNPSSSTNNLAFPKYSNFVILWSDGLFNGGMFPNPNSPGEIYGLQMIFWHSGITIKNGTSPYNNIITTTKSTWYQYDNVPIIWQVSNAIYSYQIQVWHNGTQIIDPSYPYPYTLPVSQWSGHNSYTPLHTGNYQFRLLYNSVQVASVNITVEHAIQTDFIMYVHPNPCASNTNFYVGYRYYPSDGKQGIIAINPTHISGNFSDVEKYYILTANTSGNLSYRCLNNYWVSMYKQVGSTYYSIPEVPDQYLTIIYALNANTIRVEYNTKTIDEGTSFTQLYQGSHGFYGQNVFVTLDNVIIGNNVGSTSFYYITSEVSTDGPHIAKLVLQTINGTIELANTTFTVSFTDISTQPTNPWDYLLGSYKYVFAFGIMVMFLFLPMTVASRLGMELPLLVTLGSGALGLAFCISAGILDMWVAFLVSIAIIAGAVIVMFLR